MSKKACAGKCMGGPGRPSMLPRPQQAIRARSVGPPASQSRTLLGQRPPIINYPPSSSRPQSALPLPRRTPGTCPSSEAIRRLPVPIARRPAPSNLPVPYGARSVRPSSGSRLPCPRINRPRQRGEPTPSVIVNTRIPTPSRGAAIRGNNDVNINIRLTIEPPPQEYDYEAREIEEFERLEREMQELDEFERLERQCELECGNVAGPAQVFDVVPLTPPQQTGRRTLPRLREFFNMQQGITSSGTLRESRRQQDRFDQLAAQAAAAEANISGYSMPEYDSPPPLSESYNTYWDSLVNDPNSMIADESMMEDSFDRSMWNDTIDAQGWNQMVAAAENASDLGNVSFNYESPGCC